MQVIYPLSVSEAISKVTDRAGQVDAEGQQALEQRLDMLMEAVRLSYLVKREGGWNSMTEWGETLSLGQLCPLARTACIQTCAQQITSELLSMCQAWLSCVDCVQSYALRCLCESGMAVLCWDNSELMSAPAVYVTDDNELHCVQPGSQERLSTRCHKCLLLCAHMAFVLVA